MGKIPVLEEDGVKLTQTDPILLRLAKRYGRFSGSNENDEFEILRWLFWDNHKLSGYMALYRFFRTFTPSPDPAVLEFLRSRIDDFLGIAEQHLETRAFVIGGEPSIADFSMIGYLCFPPDESGYDLAVNHPALHAWIGRIAALPGWQAPYDLLPGKHMHHYQ